MNDIKLSIDEISELEQMKYLLEEQFNGFEFKGTIEENEEEAKRQRPFEVYLLFKRSKELVELLNKYIFERYYDGKEVEIKRNAQREYCDKDTPAPNFADFGTNSKGECYNCRKNIWKHITLEKASNQLITGCPCCSRTYCD